MGPLRASLGKYLLDKQVFCYRQNLLCSRCLVTVQPFLSRDLREESICEELSVSELQQPSYPSPPLSSSAKYEH